MAPCSGTPNPPNSSPGAATPGDEVVGAQQSHPQSTGEVAGQPAHQPAGGIAGQVLPIPAQQLLAGRRDHRQSVGQGTEDNFWRQQLPDHQSEPDREHRHLGRGLGEDAQEQAQGNHGAYSHALAAAPGAV